MSVKAVLVGQNNPLNESISNKVTSISSSSTDTEYPSAKAVYTYVQTFQPFEWGDDGSEADEIWFGRLYNYLQDNSPDESWVGLQKTVTLTSEVLGTTTHLIRCIGVNQDGSNTVTFQTKNCLPTTTAFGSNAQWIGSTARSLCQSYYNAFPGKAYIKTVSKGTNTEYNTASVAYNDETVWLPSIFEVGLGSYAYAPKAAEYTNGCSTAYSYYSNNASRVKNRSDSTATACYWWTRSRRSDVSAGVCGVSIGGYASNHTYNGSNGLAPAFVIG